MAQGFLFSSVRCASSYAGHALWCAPLPSVLLLEPEQAPDSSSDGNGLLTAALEGPLLPNDQQKVSLEDAIAVCASSACYRQPSSHKSDGCHEHCLLYRQSCQPISRAMRTMLEQYHEQKVPGKLLVSLIFEHRMSRTCHVLDIWVPVQIIQEIQEDEQALQRSGMQPAMLPRLVEHNPAIAIEVIANPEVLLSFLPDLAHGSQNTIRQTLCGSKQHARRHPSSLNRPCEASVRAVAVGVYVLLANHCCWRCKLGNAPASVLQFAWISAHSGLNAGAAEEAERRGCPRLPSSPGQHGAEPAQPGGGQPLDQQPGPAAGFRESLYRQLHCLLRPRRGGAPFLAIPRTAISQW